VTDEARRHSPTARRLERLRQAGAAPHSAALVGVAVLAAATALGLLWAPTLCRLLSEPLAASLRDPAAEASLLQLLGWRLLLGGGLVVLIAAALGLTAAAAHSWQSGVVLRAPRLRAKLSLLSLDPIEALLALLGVGGSIVIIASTLRAVGEATTWAELSSPAAVTTGWLRQLCLLGALAILHLLWARARHQRQAMMTDRELRDEQRETQGSWLRGRLKQRRPR
jgi:flagellar biosynthesis protein FlhB